METKCSRSQRCGSSRQAANTRWKRTIRASDFGESPADAAKRRCRVRAVMPSSRASASISTAPCDARIARTASPTSTSTGVPLANFGFAVAAHPREPGTAWFVPGVADQQRVPVGGALAVNRTRDGGRSFETLRSGLPQRDCYDLVYRHGLAVDASGDTLLMGSTTGGLWASDDGGEHWVGVAARLPPIYALSFG